MRKQGIIYILLILALWSCREDFERNVSTSVPFSPELLEDFVPAEDMVLSSVNGFVKDEDQNPLADVLVTLNGIPTTTDIYGHFFYTDTPMNREGTVIAFEMANFHQQNKLFYPTEGAVERMDVLLSKIDEETEFNSGQSGSVALDEGILLDYSTDAFLSTDGRIYEGIVSVTSTFVESSIEDFALRAPGNFQAVNIENRLVGLQAKSLLQIEFVDEGGNELLIDPDAELTVHLPNQDTSVEAWYYAPNFGLYTVNTLTNMESNTLSVPLAHNEFILLATPFESALQTIALSADGGSGILEDIQTEVLAADGTVLQSVRSNSQGMAKIITPVNMASRLAIEDDCGNIVYNESTANMSETLLVTNVSLIGLEGDIYDCDVNPTDDGVIAIARGNKIRYHYPSSTSFELTLQVCDGGQVALQGLESGSFDAAAATELQLDEVESLGDIFTCVAPLINYLTVTNVNTGEEYIYPIETTEGSTSLLTVFGTGPNHPSDVRLSIARTGVQDFVSGIFTLERIVDPASGLNYSGDNVAFDLPRFGSRDKITIGSFEGFFENTVDLEMDELRATFNFYFTE